MSSAAQKKHVVFYEVFDEEAEALRRYMPPEMSARFVKDTLRETKDQPFVPVISLRTQSRIPPQWAGRLQGILTRSTGYDHILEYQRITGTSAACGYLPDYCSRAVAEHAVMVLLALLRKLPLQIGHFETFNRDGLTGRECAGKNLLVVGVGRIGRQVAVMAKACGMHVRGVDINPKASTIEYVSLAAGLAWAEAIICALPLTAATRNMFCYAAFGQSRPGAVFVNIGRGEIAPMGDLCRLMEEGRLSGVGLDVFEDEGDLARHLRLAETQLDSGLPDVQRLQRQKNIILTPHNAFNTKEALERKAQKTVESLVCFFENHKFVNPVPGKEAGGED